MSYTVFVTGVLLEEIISKIFLCSDEYLRAVSRPKRAQFFLPLVTCIDESVSLGQVKADYECISSIVGDRTNRFELILSSGIPKLKGNFSFIFVVDLNLVSIIYSRLVLIRESVLAKSGN